MAELTVQEGIWQRLVSLAHQQRRKPEALAERILRDYLQRVADEELLEETSRAASKAKFRIVDTEKLIKQHRREKARKATNGSA